MSLIRMAASIALCGLYGCSQAADLQDQFRKSDYRLTFEDKLHIEAASPIVVLGRVTAVNEVGTPKRSPGDPRIKTQLLRIKVDVEVPIRGDIDSEAVEFYFFSYSAENEVDLGVPRYIPQIGQRRIFFLKRWENTYRSVGDVTDYSLPVWTGIHARDACHGKEPGCCIAELLLVPEREADRQWFVHDLGPISAYAAGVLCSPEKANQLLEHLIDNSAPKISEGAADIMSVLQQWWPQLKPVLR